MDHSNPWKTATLILAGVVLGAVIGIPLSQNFDFSFFKPDSEKKEMKAFAKQQTDDWKFYETYASKSSDGFFALGEKDAPIAMTEYSDYQCPFCARFFENTLSAIKNEYVKTGQVYFVYKDLPLSSHPNAMPAAQAAHCAGEQGKYFQMHDLIFHFQDKWADLKDTMSYFTKMASVLRLKTSDFEDCVKSNRYLDLSKKSMEEADKAEITGTPGFVINGQVAVGAQPISFFQQAFAQILMASPLKSEAKSESESGLESASKSALEPKEKAPAKK